MGEGNSVFQCPICGQEYSSRQEKDECHASHFEGTGKIPEPDDKRFQNQNLVREYRRSVGDS